MHARDWKLQSRPTRRQWVWTDDYSNIVGSLLRKRDRGEIARPPLTLVDAAEAGPHAPSRSAIHVRWH